MYLKAICFDFGDTLADESSEQKNEAGITLKADLIPGAADVVRQLRQQGYPLALVADGYAQTYRNVLGQHGIYDCFDVFAISEEVGIEKPDERMFTHALDLLGIPRHSYNRTIMVGNNLARDIKGANALGIVSVWIDWAPRRPKIPADASQTPAYTIRLPLELLDVIAAIEARRG